MTDKIICFGKNYQDHMHELGDKPVEKPVIFLKPPSIMRQCKHWNEKINAYLPSEEIHYECELVFKLMAGGFQLSAEAAKKALSFYTLGLDMTKRTLQRTLKDAGHPWEIGKIFPDSAIIGPWIPLKNLDHTLSQSFSFSINQTIRQNGCGKNMMFSPIDLIVYVSQFFPLCEGDIIFTGTPSGVGKILKGDVGELLLENKGFCVSWNIV